MQGNGFGGGRLQGHQPPNARADPVPTPSQYTYDQFVNRPIYILDKLYAGTYYTEAGVYQGAPIEFKRYAPPITTPDTLIKPHTELWNIYWEAFFVQVAPHLDAIKQYLRINEHMEKGNRKVLSTRRTVAKSPGAILYVAPDDESGYPTDLRNFLQFAESFGAVTDIHFTSNELHTTFTTPRSAELFSEYLRQTGFRLSNNFLNIGGDSFAAVANLRDSTSCVLKLGPCVDIELAYVTALFADIFNARVEHNQPERNFIIKFQNAEAAKFCYHVLHQSMFKVFGLSLSFVLIKTVTDKEMQAHRVDWDVPYQAIRAI